MISLLHRIRSIAKLLPLAVAVLLVLGLASCRSDEQKTPTDNISETELAQSHGPSFFAESTDCLPGAKNIVYRNGEDKNHYAILESLGGGVGVIDFDGDGLLDLVCTGGGDFAGPDKKQIIGYPTRMFKNLGKLKFKEVTEQVLAQQPLFYSHGLAVADYDSDGWPDLLVTGYGRLALYRNVAHDDGQRAFIDVTKAAGLLKSEHFWSTSAAFADLDGDGSPDLYVCQYVDWSWKNNIDCPGYLEGMKRDVCPPKRYNAKQHAIYHNNGKGGFTEVTKEAGLRIEVDDPDKDDKIKKSTYCGKGLGVLIVDTNEDGRPELYVANDTTDNFFYLNESKPGQLRLKEMAHSMGVAGDLNHHPNGSMGVDAADIDGSGDPSLWVTNFEGELHALYRMTGQKGNKSFYYAPAGAGLAAIGQTYVGWGTGFVDLDNDGWMDLVITNGHVVRHPPHNNLAQKPILFLNRGDGKGKFKVATDQGGPYFHRAHRGRGLAIADLDNDGKADLVFSPVNEPLTVLHNIYESKNNWLGVTLKGMGQRDVVGARAVLNADGRKLTQFQKGGGSYASARDGRLLFGLGKTTQTGRLTVHWPSGAPRVESWEGLDVNRYHTLSQGEGTAP